MLGKWTYKAARNTNYYLVYVNSQGEQSMFSFIEIAFVDDEIKLIEEVEFDAIDKDSLSFFKKDFPIILHLDGGKVISKEVENKVAYKQNLIFKANVDDFYFYEYHQDERLFVSFTRKEIIDGLLKSFNKQDKYISNITFGPFVLVNVFSMLNQNTYWTSETIIHTQQNKIIDYKVDHSKANENYTFSSEQLPAYLVSLYASFIDYKFPNETIVSEKDYLKHNIEQSIFKKRFKAFGLVGLGFILMLILVGHFYLKYAGEKLAETQSQISIIQQNLSTLNKLKEQKVLKETILLKSGFASSDYLSKYISSIGNSVPNEITLEKMAIFPLEKRIKPDEKIVLNAKLIHIEGSTSSDTSFNNWIKEFDRFDWVSKHTIQEYVQDSGKDIFSIVVYLK